MSIAEKITRAKADYDEVYDAGKQAEYDAFWDTYQSYGKPKKYTSVFRGYGWTDDIYNPKYPIVCDPNQGAANAIDALFAYSGITDTKVPITYTPNIATTAASVFYLATSLVTIRKLVINERVSFSGWFGSCAALENITIEGTIGKNGFDVRWSTKLTHDSLMSIINALKDYSGSTSTYTLTLGTTNLGKLTDGEKAIATEKGWTLA